MIFSEIYSTYYAAVAKLIEEAIQGKLNGKNAGDIISNTAFNESFIYILENIKSENWQVLTKEFTTPIKHKPEMPLTTLQKRFLKTIALDPRFKLFSKESAAVNVNSAGGLASEDGLDDVEPLYFTHDFIILTKSPTVIHMRILTILKILEQF